MNPFPAIVIGGPPHSGKSVLTYLLTRQLRQERVAHYVLRACPDGEGDWSQEAPPDTVRLLRQKGAFSETFVDRVCRDLARRHLPLIVDVGGKPTLDQERILDQCTHAVLISATAEGLDEWRDRVERHGLAIIAEVRSVLDGTDRIDARVPVLRGQIAGLERFNATAGPVALELAQRLQQLLAYPETELKSYHFSHAPTDLVIDLEQLGDRAGVANHSWTPEHLPRALDEIPAAPISIYGRGPNWLYAALALHAGPHAVYLFDPRLGWVKPSSLSCAPSAESSVISWKIAVHHHYTWIDLSPIPSYLDYDEVNGTLLPTLDPQRGVVISGKIPLWLTAGVALACRHHPWIAVVQAQRYDQGIIVTSRVQEYRPGSRVAVQGNPLSANI